MLIIKKFLSTSITSEIDFDLMANDQNILLTNQQL